MSSIHFFSHEVKFQLKSKRNIISWIKKVVEQEESYIEEINYVFCSDSYLLAINQGFLKHNTLTDIITFDHSEGDSLEGEIYISIERVAENAIKYNVAFGEELNRVMIHGVLHLLGYKDKKPSEKTLMRKKEKDCLSLRK